MSSRDLMERIDKYINDSDIVKREKFKNLLEIKIKQIDLLHEEEMILEDEELSKDKLNLMNLDLKKEY